MFNSATPRTTQLLLLITSTLLLQLFGQVSTLQCFQCSTASSTDCDETTSISSKHLITCPKNHHFCETIYISEEGGMAYVAKHCTNECENFNPSNLTLVQSAVCCTEDACNFSAAVSSTYLACMLGLVTSMIFA